MTKERLAGLYWAVVAVALLVAGVGMALLVTSPRNNLRIGLVVTNAGFAAMLLALGFGARDRRVSTTQAWVGNGLLFVGAVLGVIAVVGAVLF